MRCNGRRFKPTSRRCDYGMLTRLARQPTHMLVGGTLLTVAAGMAWASSLVNVPSWWIPSFGLAVAGSLTAAFATFIYSRKQSPRLGLYLSTVFLAGAAYLVVFAFWAGTPRWMGVALLVALLPGIRWASTLK